MSKEIESSDNSQKFKTSNSESGLVVDLPDGQKILIGNLPTGTVVEIAAWRGTGAPDSRTSRLLIGAAGPEIVVESVPQENFEKRMTYGDDSIPVFSPLNEKTESQHILSKPEEIDKNATRFGRHGKVIENQPQKKRKIFSRENAKWFITISIFGVLMTLHFSGVASWVGPDSGLSSGLGSANSMVAITHNLDQYSKNDLVIFKDSQSNSKILGTVGEQVENVLLVGSEKQRFQVNSEDVYGKVLFIIPIFGYLF